LETAEPSQSLVEAVLPEKSTFLFGNERFGLSEQELEWADGVLRIPTSGIKNSLNVANACSMVLYEYCRQRI